MRKIVRALVGVTMVFAVGLAAACGPTGASSNGAGTDGWGNPIPTDAAGQAVCAVPSGPARPPVPYMGGRPADVRPGNSWVVFELTARAVAPGLGSITTPTTADYCIPINVHVYTRPGEADTVQIDDVGFEAGPFDFVTTTPWNGRYVALQYDPTDERFAGRPPAYEVWLNVNYDRARDEGFAGDNSLAESGEPVALGCAIRTDLGTAMAADMAELPGRTAVECVLKSNDGWHPY